MPCLAVPCRAAPGKIEHDLVIKPRRAGPCLAPLGPAPPDRAMPKPAMSV